MRHYNGVYDDYQEEEDLEQETQKQNSRQFVEQALHPLATRLKEKCSPI